MNLRYALVNKYILLTNELSVSPMEFNDVCLPVWKLYLLTMLLSKSRFNLLSQRNYSKSSYNRSYLINANWLVLYINRVCVVNEFFRHTKVSANNLEYSNGRYVLGVSKLFAATNLV